MYLLISRNVPITECGKVKWGALQIYFNVYLITLTELIINNVVLIYFGM
jgi:hypothetical protein